MQRATAEENDKSYGERLLGNNYRYHLLRTDERGNIFLKRKDLFSQQLTFSSFLFCFQAPFSFSEKCGKEQTEPFLGNLECFDIQKIFYILFPKRQLRDKLSSFTRSQVHPNIYGLDGFVSLIRHVPSWLNNSEQGQCEVTKISQGINKPLKLSDLQACHSFWRIIFSPKIIHIISLLWYRFDTTQQKSKQTFSFWSTSVIYFYQQFPIFFLTLLYQFQNVNKKNLFFCFAYERVDQPFEDEKLIS